MRAYKTKPRITIWFWDCNHVYQKEYEWLIDNWFKREFWFFIKKYTTWINMWIDTCKWWYIDYQNNSIWTRVAPNTITIKEHEDLKQDIKSMKELWIID